MIRALTKIPFIPMVTRRGFHSSSTRLDLIDLQRKHLPNGTLSFRGKEVEKFLRYHPVNKKLADYLDEESTEMLEAIACAEIAVQGCHNITEAQAVSKITLALLYHFNTARFYPNRTLNYSTIEHLAVILGDALKELGNKKEKFTD